MSSIVARVNLWWNSRATSLTEQSLAAQLAAANERIASLEADLEIERVKVRIQQVEIDELAAVNSRNFERVKKEMRDLSGGNGLVKTEAEGVLVP